MRCLVDVIGFVFGINNFLAVIESEVSRKHMAECDSKKEVRHSVIAK